MKKNMVDENRPESKSADAGVSKSNKTKKRSNSKSKQVSVLLTAHPTASTNPVPAKPTSKNTVVKLPSRSTLFGVIQSHAVVYKKPLNAIQLAQELDVIPTQVAALQEVLDSMVVDGDIKMSAKGSYSPISDQALISGTIQTHKDGYG